MFFPTKIPHLTPPLRTWRAKLITGLSKRNLSSCTSREIKSTTLVKYKTLANQLESLGEDTGYMYIDQLPVKDMDDFHPAWKDAEKGEAKSLSASKLIRFCLKRKRLTENTDDAIVIPLGPLRVR